VKFKLQKSTVTSRRTSAGAVAHRVEPYSGPPDTSERAN